MRRSRSRQSRSIVLWMAASFVLIQLAIGVAIDVSLPQVRDPEYFYRERLLSENMSQETDKPFVVAIGSSRVLNGLDAVTATNTLHEKAVVFNFGIPSSGPFLERVWLERLGKLPAKPDLILIEVLPAFLNGTITPRDQSELDGARLRVAEMAQNTVKWQTLSSSFRKWAVGRALPAYRHQSELRLFLRIDRKRDDDSPPEELRSLDRLGWQPRSYPADRRDAITALAHRQYDSSYRDFSIDPAQVVHLEEILSRCAREGLQTALLLMPEGSEFRRLYTAEMNAALDGMLAQLRDRYGVPIIDARPWMADASFYDMHHLMPEGAREFSVRLANEGIAPLVKEKRGMADSNGSRR